MGTESSLDSESHSEKKDKIQNAVTALKKKNALLKRKLQSLELVFRNAVDILVVVDAPTGRIRRVSDAAEVVLGYERSNLIGKKLVEILPSDENNNLLHSDDNIPEIVDGVFLDQKLKCNDGSFKSMDMTTSLVDSNGFSVILLTFRDTSERKLQLREMIKKNSALDSALSAMIMTDSSWKIDYANLEALNYWRYSRTNILHFELSDLFSFIDDFENMKSCIEEKGQWDD